MKTGNRIQDELDRWAENEQRFIKLFPSGLDKNHLFTREKLLFYISVKNKYTDLNDVGERIAGRLLNGQIKELERQLYQNPLTRFISRIVNRIKSKRYLFASKKIESLDSEKLSQTLIRLGLGNMDSKLKANLVNGAQELSLNFSYYVNSNERMEFGLTFGKGPDQLHELQAFKASLVTGNELGERREFTFDKSIQVTAAHAYNLLSGRALQLGYTDLKGEESMKWVQLDFNNRDYDGNFRLKEFNKSYGFDVSKALEGIPMTEAGAEKRQRILDRLSDGERVTVKIARGSKEEDVFIESNPQFKSIHIFDANNKKVRMEDLLKERMGLKEASLKKTADKKSSGKKQHL